MVEGLDSFWRVATYITSEVLILCICDRSGFSVRDSGNTMYFMKMSISLRV